MASLALGPSRQFLRVEIHDWPYWMKRRQGSPSPFPVCRLCSALHSNPILRCFTGLLTALFTGDFMSSSFSDKFRQVPSSCLTFRGSDTQSAGISLFGSCSLFVALLLADLTIPAPFGSMRLRGCFHEKTRTGAIFIPGWLSDFVSRLHDEGVISYLGYLNVQFILIKYTCDSKSQTLRIHYPF